MANRYWVGGAANWDATAGSKWSTTSGGAGGSAVPTAADDVYFDNGTGHGNVTIPSATTVVARSVNFVDGTGGAYADTFTFAATTSTLTIGTSTAGAGNVALKLSSGMTLTLTGGEANINYISTSATQQTITSAGKTMPQTVINGASSSYILGDNYTSAVTSTSNFTLTAGTFDTGNYTFAANILTSTGSATRTLTFGSSAVSLARNGTAMSLASTGLTITSNTATITCTATATLGCASMNMNGASLVLTGGAAPTISNGGTWNNVTRTGTAAKTDGLVISTTNLTVTGTLTVTGSSVTQRVLVYSDTKGTQRTITAAAVSLTNADFMDIVGAGAASPFTGTSIGGGATVSNTSGITCDTPVDRYWVGGGGNWSSTTKWAATTGGSSGETVPLIQDTAYVDASSGGGTITVDMPRLGALDMTNAATCTLGGSSIAHSIFGSYIMGGNVTVQTDARVKTFEGRGSHSITSAGKTFPQANWIIDCGNGSYTLGSDFIGSGASPDNTFKVNSGNFSTNNYNMSIGSFNSNNTAVRSITLGTSTIDLGYTAATNIWNTGTTINLTFSGTSSTIVFSGASGLTKTFPTGGLTFGTVTYTVANSPGVLAITGGPTIGTLNIGSGRGVLQTAGTTIAVTNWNVNGTNNGYIYTPNNDQFIASVPDSAALSITGDMDMRFRMSMDSIAQSGGFRIFSKFNSTSNQRSWRLYNSSGSLILDMSTTGSDSSTATASQTLAAAGIVAGTTYWYRVKRVQSTGKVDFYFAADSATMPSSWTAIGVQQTATTSALYDSTAKVTFGTDESIITNSTAGRYYWFQLRNNVLNDGTGIQLDAKFQDKAFGADSFTEGSSNAATVTMNQSSMGLYGDGRVDWRSTVGGTAATVSKASGNAVSDYLMLKDSTATGGAGWYAGANSINTSGNTGWTFTGAPATTKTITGKAAILVTTTKTQSGIARISVVTTKNTTGKANISATSSKTQTGIARITAQATKTQTGKATIVNTQNRTQTGKARVTGITTQTQLGKTDIKATTQKTQTGLARIEITSPNVLTGISRVTATTTKTQVGVGNIKAPVAKTQTGKASIAGVVTKTQTGKARIGLVTTKTQTGKANLYGLTQQTQTGVAAISSSRNSQRVPMNEYNQQGMSGTSIGAMSDSHTQGMSGS